MPDAEIYWTGQSGREYLYWVHPIGTYFNNEPGNYIFAKEVEPGAWEAVYVGHTDSLQYRLADAQTEADVKQHGATHVHVHTNRSGEARRSAEQADLVARWAPMCNRAKQYDAEGTEGV